MSWQFNKVISQKIDLAGKHRVTASILDGDNDQWIMLKFQSKPTDEQIRAEAQKQIDFLNNPPAPEPTIESLKAIIVAKDALIAIKDAQIAALSASKAVS